MMNNKGFWDKLAWPIVGLSPMDGVTDAAMRFVAKKHGQPDIIYTEFVSAEGLWRIKKRREMDNKIWKDLIFDEIERPVIAQLFGSDPESFYEAAKIVAEMGFDGVDINMGCPSPGLEKRGGGAGLIRNKSNAVEVVEATRRGINEYFESVRTALKPYSDLPQAGSRLRAVLASASTPLEKIYPIPVSVKTRIGSEAPDPGWWEVLAEMKLPAVAMHGRTFGQLYKGEADWGVLLQAAEIIRASGAKFLGNGDIERVTGAKLLVASAGRQNWGVVTKNGKELDLTGKMDGVLIGRAAMGNPWTLQKVTQCHGDTGTQKDGEIVTVKDRLAVMVEQAKKYEELFKELKNSPLRHTTSLKLRGTLGYAGQARTQELKTGGRFQFFPMRKHLACFARGFEGSNSLRKKLMTASSAEEVEMMVAEFFDQEMI